MANSACVHKGQRCWPCMTGGCYEKPTKHVWWDADDVEAAKEKGFPPPTGQCGCAFCGWPALEAQSECKETAEDLHSAAGNASQAEQETQS